MMVLCIDGILRQRDISEHDKDLQEIDPYK